MVGGMEEFFIQNNTVPLNEILVYEICTGTQKRQVSLPHAASALNSSYHMITN
jgi:hypothetical protein